MLESSSLSHVMSLSAEQIDRALERLQMMKKSCYAGFIASEFMGENV